MKATTIALLREYQEAKKKLETVAESNLDIGIEKYEEELKVLERILAKLKATTNDRRFEVYYLHYVKGMSLQKVADKVGYSKSGVIKICRQINSEIVVRK